MQDHTTRKHNEKPEGFKVVVKTDLRTYTVLNDDYQRDKIVHYCCELNGK